MEIESLGRSAFWGKLQPREQPTEWHPLIDHCVDVASVARRVAEVRGWRDRLAACGLPVATAEDLDVLAVLVGLHDLGKLSPAFQVARTGRRPVSHVDAGLQALQGKNASLLTVLERYLPEAVWGWLVATISHHGRPREASVVNGWPTSEHLDVPAESDRLVRTLLRAFPGATERLPVFPSAPLDRHDKERFAASHALCGLTVLADWVGSNTAWFPYRPRPEQDRVAFASKQAALAVEELGLSSRGHRQREPSFRDLFPQHSPRGLQETIADLPLPEPGSVTIFEAATGSGKTEAALHWFARLRHAGLVDGLYFALPMRTAAVQLQERVSAAIRTLDGPGAPPTVLAVPGYYQVDDWRGRGIDRYEVRWEGDLAAGRTWASEAPMRYLAAPVAVGTIDQLLLSALKTKWAHFRGVCSLRQLLVVDEVHASDVYMSELLWQVIDRQRRAGGQVLLLSATLGSRLRIRLQSPDPRSVRPPPLSDMAELAYPCVWTGRGELVPSRSTSRPKEVQVIGSRTDEPTEAMCAEAVRAVRCGARVLLIRNTVKDAVATLERLIELVEPGELLTVGDQAVPHHSRFAPSDRRLLDQALLAQLGREPLLEHRHPVVAVTTQTAEQSLDLDADVLITDLCPMDVLLQRIGRVHRHAAQRPVGFEIARALVFSPSSEMHLHDRGEGLGTVYEDLPVLEATRRLVEEVSAVSGTWTLPRDNRELVERATHPETIAALVDEVPEMEQHVLDIFGKRSADRGAAAHASHDWFKHRFRFDASWYEPHKTRLGLEAVHLEVVPPIPSPLQPGTLIHALDVPQHLLRDAEIGGADVLRTTPEALVIEGTSVSLAYYWMGLRVMGTASGITKQ